MKCFFSICFFPIQSRNEDRKHNRSESLPISGIPEATYNDQNGTTCLETSQASVHKIVELVRFLLT